VKAGVRNSDLQVKDYTYSDKFHFPATAGKDAKPSG
jgi:hypothetical protein